MPLGFRPAGLQRRCCLSFIEELKRRNVFRVGIAYGVTAWVLLQFADLVLDNIVAPAWVMHVLMLLVALGFVVSLVVAWAYELTPEGIKRESEVDRDQSVTGQTARKLHYVTLGAIVLLIVLLLADRFMPASNNNDDLVHTGQTTEAAGDTVESDSSLSTQLARGVAVLPFANMSEDPANAFFAGGVHEDILTNLSRIADLRVISRTSMLKIAEQGLDVREIGLQLNVSHVLEGSVRRAGDQVRVTVQLIDASNDDHLWANNYDRKLDDVFAMQSEIAQKIAAQLETEFSPEQALRMGAAPTKNTQAYDLYIKARELRRTWLGAEGFKKMQPLLEQAVALDPDFLDAKLMLAMAYGRMVWTGVDPDGIYRDKARLITDQIVRQWPDQPEKDIAEGNYHYTVERDYQKALFAYQKALPFMPNDVQLLIGIASCYKRLDQFALGLPVISLAETLDPENPSIAAEKAFHLGGNGRYEEALVHARDSAERFPDDITMQITFANYSLSIKGDKSEYLRLFEFIKLKNPEMIMYNPLVMRMQLSDSNIDPLIDLLRQIQSGKDFWTARVFETQIAELLNLAGREDESRQLASAALALIEERLVQNPLLGGNQAALDYANFAYLACLADDAVASDRFRALANSTSTLEHFDKLIKERMLGQARAECGDAEAFWAVIKDTGSSFYASVSNWQLALDPLYQHYFKDIPEYQEMVEMLRENQ
jgi:TolB-like protein